MSFQEEYDNQKYQSAQPLRVGYDEEFVRTLNKGVPILSSRSKSDQNSPHNDLASSQPLLAHKSTLTLAEKKRIQWQAEKGLLYNII